MKGKILITDTMFIFSEHEKMITDAGYEIERLPIPDATEAQLIEAIKDKVGFIDGGIEKVTAPVFESANVLRAVAFTGTDWKNFLPGHETATKKGIAISNAPGANSYAVTEYTTTLILAMTRNIFDLGRTGKNKFHTEHSLAELTVGIIGMGKIGTRVARNLKALGAKKIIYSSPHQKQEIELEVGASYVPFEEIFSQSDIVTLHSSKDAGVGFVGKKELSKMKDGSLIVNCGFTGSIDKDALFDELNIGRLRAAQDDPMDDRFEALPLSVWFNSNAHMAYNTFEANKTASDMATKSLLNLLETGSDQYKVN